MQKLIHLGRVNILVIVLLSFCANMFFSSCSHPKRVQYFKDVPDTLQNPAMAVEHYQFEEPKIQSNDILNVNIATLDPSVTEVFKQSTNTENSSDAHIGYMVNKNGVIDLPIVGQVKVEGLTTSEATTLIRERAGKYYKDPVVNVQFGNFYFIALGEVNNPGKHYVLNEKINIMEAIGMAKDLTITGRRENVLLIREENGKKVFVRFDLNSTDIFNSPYYYLRTGDVLYVEPNKKMAKSATTDLSRDRYITYIASLLSISISFVTILRR